MLQVCQRKSSKTFPVHFRPSNTLWQNLVHHRGKTPKHNPNNTVNAVQWDVSTWEKQNSNSKNSWHEMWWLTQVGRRLDVHCKPMVTWNPHSPNKTHVGPTYTCLLGENLHIRLALITIICIMLSVGDKVSFILITNTSKLNVWNRNTFECFQCRCFLLFVFLYSMPVGVTVRLKRL